jgi:hypothetical protein
MKRQDVQIGVEYAETAPLAYGREPRVTPKRVRFTDNRPGPWGRVITQRRRDDDSGWTVAESKIVNLSSTEGRQARSLPTSLREAFVAKWGRDEVQERKSIAGNPYDLITRVIDRDAIPADGEVTYLNTEIKGGLPAERWDPARQEWRTTLIAPAYVHRTWAEVEAQQAERQAVRADLDAKSRVDDINALLATIGLSDTIVARRIGSGLRIDLASIPGGGFDGDRLLGDLTAWAQAHGLIAKVVT